MESLQSEQSVRPDGELLRRYLDSRDDVALTELITRHAALVRGVCRRVLGNSPDADDAFQATFLVLVRSGGRILRPQSLAAWLFGVAHRISKRQRRQRGLPTQSVREDQVMIEHDPLAELATRHDISLFDAELARLPEKYRAPIVLHHLQGKTQREVAAELQLTEGAVDGLLKRGRNELRVRLARQGVVFGITLAALQTAQNALAAVPPQPLIETTVQGMLLYDSQLHVDPINTPVARLAHQEMSTMALFQVTKLTAWTLVGSLFLGAAGVGVSTARHKPVANQAGVIASELVVAQAAKEPEATVSGPSTENSPKDGDGVRIENIPEGTGLIISGAEDLPDGTVLNIAQTPADLREGKLSDHPFMKELEKKTELKLPDATLSEAMQAVNQRHGLSIYVADSLISSDAENPQNISMELSGVTLRTAFKLMLEPRGLDYIIDDDVVKIVTKQAAENFHEMRIYRDHPWNSRMDNSRLQALIKDAVGGLWKQPGSDGPGGTIQVTPAGVAVRQNQRTLLALERFLVQLEQQGDKAVSRSEATEQPPAQTAPGTIRSVNRETNTAVINLGSADNLQPRMALTVHGQTPAGYGTEQRHGTIEITRVLGERLAEARIVEEDLQHLIQAGNAVVTVALAGVHSEATTQQSVQPQMSIRKSNPAEARIFAKLNDVTEISFVETTLRDALEFVEDLHKIDILILESEVNDDGGTIDHQVNLEMSNVSLESMLDRLLEPLELDYVIDDEVMLITTKIKAEERLETRVYPMKQLPAAWSNIPTDDAASTMKLTNLIMQAVAGKWTPDEPKGGMIGLTSAGLIVRQTQRTHREIENLMDQLRRAGEAK